MSQVTSRPEPPDSDDLGPVEYLVVEFPAEHIGEADFDTILDLVERDVIRVLDLEFVAKSATGEPTIVDLTSLGSAASAKLSTFQGSSSGLLDSDDLGNVGALLAPDTIAAVFVCEQTWLAVMSGALRTAGARVVATGYVDFNDLDAALGAGAART